MAYFSNEMVYFSKDYKMMSKLISYNRSYIGNSKRNRHVFNGFMSNKKKCHRLIQIYNNTCRKNKPDYSNSKSTTMTVFYYVHVTFKVYKRSQTLYSECLTNIEVPWCVNVCALICVRYRHITQIKVFIHNI